MFTATMAGAPHAPGNLAPLSTYSLKVPNVSDLHTKEEQPQTG